ncbi:AraC family transcriptional regulator [Prevotella rectalis]|uniref:AraC family transcriptional regulator n=1 Tax=Prevotella rectalis TaxID=2219999 RepID=UPI00102F9D67|nr:helix-turn-helix domain-containing protein [Prevotella brunnea]
MTEYNDDWIIKTTHLQPPPQMRNQDMLLNAYCVAGSCELQLNGTVRQLQAGCLLLALSCQSLKLICASPDFAVEGLFIDPVFFRQVIHPSGHTVRYALHLHDNPIVPLLSDEGKLWRRDYENLFLRINRRESPFRGEMIIAATWQLTLNCFDFTARLYGRERMSVQKASLATGFFRMLEAGDYRAHRNISHYSDKLFVTPKHLSEVIKKVSGHSANYWITRYTVAELRHLLLNTKKTMTELAADFNFSSVCYLTHYLRAHLGVSPSRLRE